MLKRTLISMSVASSMLLTACGSDDSDDSSSATATPTAAPITATATPTATPTPMPAMANVRVWHASPDAPAVKVFVDDALVLDGVDYRGVSNWLSLDAGNHNIKVHGITPGGEVEVINTDVTLMNDYQYEIAAVNDTSAISAAVISKMADTPADGNLQVQVAHLAPDAPQVSVHVSAPNDPLSNATVVATLAFGENTDELEIPAGDYRIRISLPNDFDTVVYDSGSVALTAGSELFISALENTDANSSVPVSLAVSTGDSSFNLYDVNQGADLKVVHNSSDTPNVDITADDFNSILVTDLEFQEMNGPLNVPGATYNLDIGVTGQNTSALAVDGLVLENAMNYSAIALGSLAADSLEVLALMDNDRAIATHSKVRIVHGSTTAGPVDIYVTEQGDTDLSDNTPAFESVPYKAETGYVPLTPGSYTVHVAIENTTTVAIEADLDLAAGDVYTAIARDPAQGESTFGLILY